MATEKTTKVAQLREKDEVALQAEIKELQKAHFNLRMQKGTNQLNNTASLRQARRDVARAKTILAQKQATK